MEFNKKNKIEMFSLIGIILILFIFFFASSVSAYAVSNSQFSVPGFNSFNYNYGSSVNLYPSYDEKECGAGQDFILQIDPLGCDPSVVRSDLLEEQDVPVFCSLKATKLNPLIKVKSIDYISFKSPEGYPKEVSGVGFHPTRAGIKGNYKQLLNSPILGDIGNVVIVLKKQKNESAMPDFVHGNLTAKIKYDMENAFGTGRAYFYLPEISDSDWEKRYPQYGFWQGRGFLRAESVNDNNVIVSIYRDSNYKISTVNLQKGKKSRSIYLPGFYCRAGLQLKLTSLENPDTKARLNINGDYVEVKENEKFLENRCFVSRNGIIKQGLVQRVYGRCNTDEGVEKFDFRINPKIKLKIKNSDGNEVEKGYNVGDFLFSYESSKSVNKFVYLGYAGTKGNSGNKEDLFVYLVELPLKMGDKLNENELSYIARLARNYENSPYETNGFSKFMIRSAKYIIGKTTDFTKNIFTGEKVKKLEFSKILDYKNNKVSIVDYSGGGNKILNKDAEEYYDNSIKDFRTIVDSFPNTKKEPTDTETFGEKALLNSIRLSNELKQNKDLKELCGEFEERYPESSSLKFVKETCENKYLLSNSGITDKNIVINGNSKSISFKGIYAPTIEDYSVRISVKMPESLGGNITKFTLRKNQPVYLDSELGDFITLVSLTDDYAELRINTARRDGNEKKNSIKAISDTKRIKKNIGETFGSPYVFTLTKINLKKQAKILVIPDIQNTETDVNFSFNIGIEKRAIQLSPEKTKDMIKNINKSLEKWEKISNTLSTTVKGFKAVCLTTGTYLTVKNFFEGFGGKAGARQEVTKTYRDVCNKEIKGNSDLTMEKCLVGYNDIINENVKNFGEIRGEQKKFSNNDLCSNRAKNLLKGLISKDMTNPQKPNSEDKITRKELENINVAFGENKDTDGNCNSQISSGDASKIDFYNNLLKADSGLSNEVRKEIEIKRYNLLKKMSGEVGGYALLKKQNEEATKSGFEGTIRTAKIKGTSDEFWDGASTKTGGIKDIPSNTKYQQIRFKGAVYTVTLVSNKNGNYGINKVYDAEGKNLPDDDENNRKVSEIKSFYGEFKKIDASSFKNKYENPEVIYWETGKNKGLPAVVPLDTKNGWYVATQPLSRDTMGAYDKSAVPSFFYICNVMANNRQDGIGKPDDSCIEIVNEKAQGGFNGVNMKNLINKATKIIRSASQQYTSGVKQITINGERIKVGNPVSNLPGTECEDFMSPKDCNLLFNVCDPVICPSSRCDLGGKYPVSNVIQSGIIGSAALCLPNFGKPSDGGVVVPVCLSGIKAGVDSLLSVFQAHRDCLQKSLDTGEVTGICDEIQSIYLCEFLWKQAIPLSDIILPKAFDYLKTGSFSRKGKGGGEYMFVNEAWSNSKKSVDYMANYYAANSYKAFQTRSTDEVGSTFCKLSVSARYPTSGSFFDALLEPDVPFQASGWFSESIYTTKTIPSTSQYKMFFHIYAGKDTGVYYNVYLKNPTGSSYYGSIPIINPPSGKGSGYIAKGEYADETIDFTAPSGYQEMCINVNGQEQCGFKQVSTSFALNYVSDKYIQNQFNNSNIKSEKECVSGTPSLSGLLTSPNLQTGTETSLNPELYKRGITRICSTENPGKGTDPNANGEGTKWVEVGSCDNNKGNLKCWLDSQSVRDTVNFETTANETLKDLTKNVLDKLNENYLGKTKLEDIKKMNNNQKIIDKITDNYIQKFFFNKQKAELYLKRGIAYFNLAIEKFRIQLKKEKSKNNGDNNQNNNNNKKESEKINVVRNKDIPSNCYNYYFNINKYAKENKIDPILLLSVMIQESSCDSNSRSKEGSYGLMQLQKKTFGEVCSKLGNFRDIKLGETNAEKNIECGAMILKKKYNDFGEGVKKSWAYINNNKFESIVDNCIISYPKYRNYDTWDAALRAYNGWGCGEGADTDYVEKVMAIYDKLKTEGFDINEEITRIKETNKLYEDTLPNKKNNLINYHPKKKSYKITSVNLEKINSPKSSPSKVKLTVISDCDNIKFDIISKNSLWGYDLLYPDSSLVISQSITGDSIILNGNMFESGKKYYAKTYCMKGKEIFKTESSNILVF